MKSKQNNAEMKDKVSLLYKTWNYFYLKKWRRFRAILVALLYRVF